MPTAKISTKGQLVIPSRLRKALHLRPGDEVDFTLEDQRLGGLIMWVPGTLFWWAIMSVVYFRKLAPESRADDSLAPRPL